MAEYYKITDRLVPVTWEECQKAPEETYLARLTRKETEKSRFLHSIGYGAVFGTSKIHLCKVEAYMRFLYGTYLTPDRRRMEDAFCFVFDDRHLYLVEEGELAGNLLCRLKKIFEQENAGTGSVLTAFLGQLLQKDLLQSSAVKEVARIHGITPMQVLLAFVLYKENVIAIPRSGKAEHVLQNLEAGKVHLTAEEYARLDAAFPAPREKIYLDIV